MRRISVSAVARRARIIAEEVKTFVVDCRGNPWVYIQEQQFPQPPTEAHLTTWPEGFVMISEGDRLRMLLALVPTGPIHIVPSRPGGDEAMKRPQR